MVHTRARSNVFLALAAFPRFTVVLPVVGVVVLIMDEEDEDEEAGRIDPRRNVG
jgi:branched-subunit amino acid permease